MVNFHPMAIVIRFSKVGRKREKKYKIIVKEKRSKRDGKAIDIIGTYEKSASYEAKKIDEKKLKYWLSQGAQVTTGVKKII